MTHDALGLLRDSRRDDTLWELLLERGRLELSAPAASILRLRALADACTRTHYELAVPPSIPQPLVYPSALEAEVDALRVVVAADGRLEVLAQADAHTLVPLFALHSLAARPAGESLLRRPVPLTPAHAEEEAAQASQADFVAGMHAVLEVGADAPLYGLGEETGPMNRRGRVVTTWNLDTWPHTPSPTPLYASFPFVLTCRRYVDEASGAERQLWYGLLCDNPARARFDLGATQAEQLVIDLEAGDLDLYVLAGPTPQEVVRRLGMLTGTLEMPPRWMLGFQQSRWSYYPDQRVLEVAQAYRTHQLPCDVIYIDIHYLEAYRAFTWHGQRFPDPKGLIDALHALDFRVVVILNSAVATDPEFSIFAAGRDNGYFLTRSDGSIYEAEMWPGPSAFPDFTRVEVRDWWAGLHAELLALGVDGVWNDMNEPTIFLDPSKTFPESLRHDCDGQPRPHLEVHNIYGMLMDQATHQGIRAVAGNRRLPLMTRAGYPGVQRHAFMWTGDNSSWWEHLPMAISQVANLGLCGMPFCGPDIGGFNDDCTPELFARWMQMGVLFPYTRAHSAQGTRDQEPWTFGEQTMAISRRYVALRYRLLPYLYTLMAAMVRHGDLMLRPLFYQYPHDPHALEADDQFMLGPDLLVAPIMAQGRGYRAVYLPAGWWMNWFEGTWHQGGKVIVVHADLESLPLFVRGGALLALAPDGAHHVSDAPHEQVEWHLYVPPTEEKLQVEAWLFEDDGISEPAGRAAHNHVESHVRGHIEGRNAELTWQAARETWRPAPRRFELEAHVAGVERSVKVEAWTDAGLEHRVRLNW